MSQQKKIKTGISAQTSSARLPAIRQRKGGANTEKTTGDRATLAKTRCLDKVLDLARLDDSPQSVEFDKKQAQVHHV